MNKYSAAAVRTDVAASTIDVGVGETCTRIASAPPPTGMLNVLTVSAPPPLRVAPNQTPPLPSAISRGSVTPVLGQMAKLKMADFAELPILPGIHTSRVLRFIGIARLGVKALGAATAYRWSNFIAPAQHRAHRAVFQQRLAQVLGSEIGVLKGPYMKFAQMVSYLTINLPPLIRDALQPLQFQSPPLDRKSVV